jgi:DNA-directed RNA polymerase subunit beta
MEKKAFLTTLPDFVEIQRASFCWFLEKGLSQELEKINSISNPLKTIEIQFFCQEYRMKKPKYDVFESKKRNSTYSIKLYIPVTIKYYKNLIQTVYTFIGEIPLMSDRGTFIINGYERVIVNQIIRSPGIYFKEQFTKTGSSIYSATVIPNRGSWLNFEIDKNHEFTCNIDKSDKINIEYFFFILGINYNEIPKNWRNKIANPTLINNLLEKSNIKSIFILQTEDKRI